MKQVRFSNVKRIYYIEQEDRRGFWKEDALRFQQRCKLLENSLSCFIHLRYRQYKYNHLLKMFHAKSKFAGKFKTLFEILYQNLSPACFTINKDGMFFQHYTTQNLIISVDLPSSCFEEFSFSSPESLYIGLGNHINKEFFKTIKNNDIIFFKITTPGMFEFTKQSDTTLQVLNTKTEIIQNIIPITLPTFTFPGVNVKSEDFCQTYKSFNSNSINVIKNKGLLCFSFDTGRSTKTVTYGVEDLNDLSLFHQTFTIEQFNRIIKIGAFSSGVIQIFAEPNQPLLLLCESPIGVLKIYMHSLEF